MNKKVWIFLIIIVLAVAAGGFFYWWWSEEKSEIGRPENLENYILKETQEGKIIENRNVGLSFKIPKGWNMTKTDNITSARGGTDYGLMLTSPDMKPDPESYWILLPQEGCLINVYVRHDKEKVQRVKDEIKIAQERLGEKIEALQIDGKMGLKTIYGAQEGPQDNPQAFVYITVEIPLNNKVYSFESYIPSQDEEKCIQEFSEFLETVSID